MASRKMVPLSLFPEQQWPHGHKEHTREFSGGRRRQDELREQHWNLYITMCKLRWPVEICCVIQGAQIQCSVATWRDGTVWGELQEGPDMCILIQSAQFSSVAQSCPTAIHGVAARQASLSITNSQSLLKLMSIESVMPSNHLILYHPLLLLPPVPPSIRVFSNELTLPWGAQSTGVSASASVLPMNTQE